MISNELSLAATDNDEIPALIATLFSTGRRLEELTAGEVDSVVGLDGRTFLLQRAQEELRHGDAQKQAGILNALPAHVVLLDMQGVIVSVNEGWRRFARANALKAAEYGVGLNYLTICDEAVGDHSAEAYQVAAGIRDVLSGSEQDFSLEYPCHSPVEQRWFLVTVTPLAEDRSNGVVVMHLNITERKRAEKIVRQATSQVVLSRKKHSRIEALILIGLTGAFFEFSLWLSWFQSSTNWLVAHAAQDIDDIIVTLLFLVAGLIVFGFRRWRESESELTVRRQSQGVLELLHGELEAQVAERTDELARANQTLNAEIAQRKRASDSLTALAQKTERRERMLTTMLANLHDFAYLYDRDGRFLFANQPLLDLWGLTLDEVLGKNFHDLGYPDDLARRLQQELQTVCETAKSVTGETPYESPSGNQGVYEYIFSPALARDGSVEFVVGSTRDITERRVSEAAVQASEQRLRDLIDGVGPAIFVGLMTPEGILIECNRPALAAAGLKPEDALGKLFWETYWFSHAETVKQLLHEAIIRAASGEASRFDLEIRGPGDSFVDVDFSLEPLRDATGKVVFLVPSASVITERKQTEDALRVSEERLRAALAASRTGTFRWEFSTNELSWDASLDALFGIPQGQAVHSLETFIVAVHPDDRADVIERCERCEREGADFDAEFRVVWPDGSLHWLDDKGKTFFDAAGRPIYMTGACVDITDRKLSETARRESEAEFRALAEAMPQMVWITRADGWNIYFSQQWMDYTGLSLEESMGHGWNKPFHPDDQQAAWDAWQQATSTTGIYSVESRLRRADGIYRWWLIRGVPQIDAAGKILKWFGTCTDIHELKLAELEISRTNQALTESDEKFRQLADNISDVFWVASTDLKEIRYISSGYETIWGRSAESLYANPHQWVETILPEERDGAFKVFGELMHSAPEVSVEYQIARPDGTIRWIHDRGFQVRDAAGKLVGLTGIASDITERKKLESQLRQGQKMEAIGTLAGGIAHDFNNILAAIMGYTELALKGIPENARANGQLRQVLKASARARDLVRQILAFSRREEHEQQAVQLQDIIRETLKLLEASLPATIVIRQNIDPATLRILGDATQIQQVLMNLCVNSAHAMKGGNGILEISLSSANIGPKFRNSHPELKSGPHVCLSVRDTGCGFEPELHDRVFDPFFTTKAPGEGTGLGLAVVHGIVKKHGGAISVQSEPGVGTTFSLYLPAYYGTNEVVVNESDAVSDGKGEHILFVDDEEALVSLGEIMLGNLGYRVTSTTNSVEALATFRAHPDDFDLVITDQTMPHLNGGDLAKAILQIRPAMPVILTSGYSAVLTPEMAVKIGIQEFLAKPTTMQTFGEAIRRALSTAQVKI